VYNENFSVRPAVCLSHADNETKGRFSFLTLWTGNRNRTGI